MDLNQLMKSWGAINVPKIEKRILVVHPSRIKEMQGRKYLFISDVSYDIDTWTGIQIVQNPHIPLTQMVRVKRWLSKRDRKRLYVRKYRNEKRDVLGYWLYLDRMAPTGELHG